MLAITQDTAWQAVILARRTFWRATLQRLVALGTERTLVYTLIVAILLVIRTSNIGLIRILIHILLKI